MCWFCYLPQIDDGLHPTVRTAADCIVPDKSYALLFSIYFSERTRYAAQNYFHTSWISPESFCAWLSAPPAPNQVNNPTELMLWYVETFMTI
jgi:hypothetical protein